MSNTNKLYWLLQVCGWSLVGLAMLFFAHVYQAEISTGTLFARIVIVFTTGILTTHILRIFIKWRGWLLQSIEKVIPKLIIAMVVTSMIYSAIILTEVDFFGLDSPSSHKLSFINKLMGSTVDNGLFILPWVLIYYFYHFIEKSRKQQLDTLQLESLIKEL
jgi:two-component system LytT family sensor kinase